MDYVEQVYKNMESGSKSSHRYFVFCIVLSVLLCLTQFELVTIGSKVSSSGLEVTVNPKAISFIVVSLIAMSYIAAIGMAIRVYSLQRVFKELSHEDRPEKIDSALWEDSLASFGFINVFFSLSVGGYVSLKNIFSAIFMLLLFGVVYMLPVASIAIYLFKSYTLSGEVSMPIILGVFMLVVMLYYFFREVVVSVKAR